jgi:hypothetical protein
VADSIPQANILIDALANPLTCDFGLVRILDTEQPDWGADYTTTVHIGSIPYLAYEPSKDPPELRFMAGDIHALGCVTYEVCAFGIINIVVAAMTVSSSPSSREHTPYDAESTPGHTSCYNRQTKTRPVSLCVKVACSKRMPD